MKLWQRNSPGNNCDYGSQHATGNKQLPKSEISALKDAAGKNRKQPIKGKEKG